MGTIHSNDMIFATLSQRGGQAYKARISGVTSMAQIVAHMRALAPGLSGLSTLDVRNAGQGWSASRSIYM